MGVKQAFINRNNIQDEQPRLIPETFIWNDKREKWFQMIHPSITYRIIKFLKENLKMKDESVVKGTIFWNPCENRGEDERSDEIIGIVKYRMGYMLAAAILRDQEKLIQGAKKGYLMIEDKRTNIEQAHQALAEALRNPDELFENFEDYKDSFEESCRDYYDFEESVFVKCGMEYGNEKPYDMVKIQEYSLWGMLLWPVWEEETEVHHTLWEILKKEYQSADDDRKWQIKKVILDSIDSLYIREYQEKAMNICRKVLPEAYRVNYRDWKPGKWHKRVNESPMQWEMSIIDSWTKMIIVTESKIFASINGNAECQMNDFIQEWASGVREFDRAREQINEADISYSEKKWKFDGITIKPWKNKIWPEDKISRHLGNLEKMEYISERNGEKIQTRFILFMYVLDRQMRETDWKLSDWTDWKEVFLDTLKNREECLSYTNRWKWENYLGFLICSWDKAEEAKQMRILPEEIAELWIREIKKRICQLNRNIPELKKKCIKLELRKHQYSDTEDIEQSLRKMEFYKNKIAPMGELPVNIKDMYNLPVVHCASPFAAETPDCEEYLTSDSADMFLTTNKTETLNTEKAKRRK